MATPPDDQSCAVCRYYIDGVSECHRYPPLLAAPTYRAMAPWPAVAPDAWCGEFGKIPGTPPAVPTHKRRCMMAYYYKSESEVAPIAPPDKPPEPPLVIWGPGDPRPTLPIAGWNPGSGTWPTPPPTQPPDGFWGAGGPIIDQPIAEPPWGWGNPAPVPPVDPIKGWQIKYGWNSVQGWYVFAIPTGPVPTPSKRK